MEPLLRDFPSASAAELLWLQEVLVSVERTVLPVAGHAGSCAGGLVLAVIRTAQRALGLRSDTLPLSYRLVSVAELLARQRTPCCSHMTWSTAQFRVWAQAGERRAAGRRALPRDNLLLIGRLMDHRDAGPDGAAVHDGSLSLRDGSGALYCEVLQLSPDWLGRLMLFPGWTYIPQVAMGVGQEARGYLELSAPPLPLHPDPPMIPDPGAPPSLTSAMTPQEATALLRERSRAPGVRVAVWGQLSVLCPLLAIAGRTFFCLTLSDRHRGSSVPVLVMEPALLVWQRCLGVGDWLAVTGLRVCVLRSWGRRHVLCVTPQSRLHPLDGPLDTDTQAEGRMETDTQTDRRIETQAQAETERQADRQTDALTHSAYRHKRSKIIDYKGVVSRVLNAEAGLYEIDGQVGLCLAYQQVLNCGRGLRPGAEIELRHVHFLFRPSPHFPLTMLCACLRTTLRLGGFSAVGSEFTPFDPRGSPAVRFLLERELSVSDFLWACHCVCALRERLCPRFVKPGRLLGGAGGGAAGRFLRCVLGTVETGRRPERDIYREMLDEPHSCPLVEYRVGPPPCQSPSMRELCDLGVSLCWGSMCLSSLLPPEAPHLTSAELNLPLAWSVHCKPSPALRPPAVLVGLLGVCVRSGCVRLQDQTGCVDCVCVERGATRDSALTNPAWIGCLVCVQRFTLLTERFLQTDFPSWAQLDQPQYIRHRHCRVYIQLCVDDVEILSPSAAMSASRRGRERRGKREEDREVEGAGERDGTSVPVPEQDEGRSAEQHRETEGAVPAGATGLEGEGAGRDRERAGSRSRKRRAPSGAGTEQRGRGLTSAPPPPPPPPCVSLLLQVLWKEGLALGTAGFVAAALLLGGPRVWVGDPRDAETDAEGGASTRVDLQFVGEAVRWYPFLHPGCLYSLTAPNTADPSVLSVSPSVPVRTGAQSPAHPSLPVSPHWTLQSLTRPEVCQCWETGVQSVSDVLNSRDPLSLVSFEGRISQRITLQEEKGKTPVIQSLPSDLDAIVESGLRMRLTVCDLLCPWLCVQLYADLSQRPYPPGLVPGATVLFQRVQRKVSRAGNVYCRSVVISCLTVMQLGDGNTGEPQSLSSSSPSPPAIRHLGEWAHAAAPQCVVGQLRGHVVCVLFLELRWTCSLCGSVFKQDSCTRNYPPCNSDSGVFQAVANVVVEDGSAEARVRLSTPAVLALLALGSAQWEGLQQLVRVRGHLRLFNRGRSAESRGSVQCDDPLVQFLSLLCSSPSVCRSVGLSCRLQRRPPTPGHENCQLRRFTRGDREFVTKMPTALQLHCAELTD
ncbi:CST complex subunit CTC1 isoform X2 [Amia ocellicauda]|uniref:CST complex subunit CTC1 isoform X2 n=1 Tax=Amia ocellicauda TaxID=2972642 RepID=UPI0034644A2D